MPKNDENTFLSARKQTKDRAQAEQAISQGRNAGPAETEAKEKIGASLSEAKPPVSVPVQSDTAAPAVAQTADNVARPGQPQRSVPKRKRRGGSSIDAAVREVESSPKQVNDDDWVRMSFRLRRHERNFLNDYCNKHNISAIGLIRILIADLQAAEEAAVD